MVISFKVRNVHITPTGALAKQLLCVFEHIINRLNRIRGQLRRGRCLENGNMSVEHADRISAVQVDVNTFSISSNTRAKKTPF